MKVTATAVVWTLVILGCLATWGAVALGIHWAVT